MTIERTNADRICSFCTQLAADPLGNGQNIFVCESCHYHLNVEMGNVRKGAIYCFRCNTYSSFRAVYNFGTAHFVYGADDPEGVPIYVPTKVVGSWRRSSVPNKLQCGSCNGTIPTSYIYMNSWTTPIVK